MNGLTTTKSLIKGLFRYILLLGTTAIVVLSNSVLALFKKSKRQTVIQQFDTLIQSNSTPLIPIVSSPELFRRLQEKSAAAPVHGLDVDMAERSHGDVSTYETMLLSVLVKTTSPKNLFEFGTFKGRTTHHLAANSAPEAKIWTLDLPAGAPTNGNMDEYDAWLVGQKGITGQQWLNDPPALKNKITQLWGDSMTFDYSPYYDQMDFIFIDACHTYEYVLSDTKNALRMLKPRGLIVWDNFDRQRNTRFHDTVNRWHNRDLNHFLFELFRERPLVQVADTGFVVCLGRTPEALVS